MSTFDAFKQYQSEQARIRQKRRYAMKKTRSMLPTSKNSVI